MTAYDQDETVAPGSSAHSHGVVHGVVANADIRYLRVALGLIVGFMAVEVVVAFVVDSLVLLSDAGHMLTDAGAIAASLWAIRLAERPAAGSWTYGWKRAEILSAAVNGITLLVVSGVVTIEAIRRLLAPPPVQGGPVLGVALLGVLVNLAAAWTLAKANRSSLTVEGSFHHILTDLYGFIATVIAGVVILFTGFTRADSIASLVVVALMLRAAASRRVGGFAALGLPAFQTTDGTTVFLNKQETLQADATRLPRQVGKYHQLRSDLSYLIASRVVWPDT